MNVLTVENLIKERLASLDLDAYSVFYTTAINGGMLSITFHMNEILKLFLKEIDFDSRCDKSGFEIYEDTNTVVMNKGALTDFVNYFNHDKQRK